MSAALPSLKTHEKAVSQPFHPLRRLSNPDVTPNPRLSAAAHAAAHPTASDPATQRAADTAVERDARRFTERRRSLSIQQESQRESARRMSERNAMILGGSSWSAKLHGIDEGLSNGGAGPSHGLVAGERDGLGLGYSAGSGIGIGDSSLNATVRLSQLSNAGINTLSCRSVNEFIIRRNLLGSYHDVKPRYGPDGAKLGDLGYRPTVRQQSAARHNAGVQDGVTGSTSVFTGSASYSDTARSTAMVQGRRSSLPAMPAERLAKHEGKRNMGGDAAANGGQAVLSQLGGRHMQRGEHELDAIWDMAQPESGSMLMQALTHFFKARLGEEALKVKQGMNDPTQGAVDANGGIEAAMRAATLHAVQNGSGGEDEVASSGSAGNQSATETVVRAARAIAATGSAALDAFAIQFGAGQVPTPRVAIEKYRAALKRRDYPLLPLLAMRSEAEIEAELAADKEQAAAALEQAKASGERIDAHIDNAISNVRASPLTAARLVLLSSAGAADGTGFVNEIYSFLDHERQIHRAVCTAFCFALSYDHEPTALNFGVREVLRADGALAGLAAVVVLVIPIALNTLRFLKLGGATHGRALMWLASGLRHGACPELRGLELCFGVDCGTDQWTEWAFTVRAATGAPVNSGNVAVLSGSDGPGGSPVLRQLTHLYLGGCYAGVDSMRHFAKALLPRGAKQTKAAALKTEGEANAEPKVTNTVAASDAVAPTTRSRPRGGRRQSFASKFAETTAAAGKAAASEASALAERRHEALAPSLRSLKFLDLSRNGGGQQGVGALAAALRAGALPRLASLNLARNATTSDAGGDLGSGGVAEIARGLAGRATHLAGLLVHLDVSGNRGNAAAFEALGDAFGCGSLRGLRSLVATHNVAGDLGAIALAKGICRLAKRLRHSTGRALALRKLDLGDNSMGDEGARALLEHLREYCPGLRRLGLSHNHLGPATFRKLAQAMRGDKDVGGENEGGGGSTTARSGAAGGGGGSAEHHSLQSLEYLDFASCRAQEEGCAVLCGALSDAGKSIKVVNLASNGIGMRGIAALAQMLQKNGREACAKLKVLNIEGNMPPALGTVRGANSYFTDKFLRHVKVIY